MSSRAGSAEAVGPDTVVRASARIASRVVDGKAVVIVIDEQTLHTLNAVGTFVWEEVSASPRRVQELVEATSRTFEVDADRAQRDVLAFVGQLVELGAVELGTA